MTAELKALAERARDADAAYMAACWSPAAPVTKALMDEYDEAMRAFRSGIRPDAVLTMLAENERLRQALECWPLKELLTDIEDSGATKLKEKARWFSEVRTAALGRQP